MTHGDVPNVVPCTFSLGNPRVARTFQGLLELMQISSKRGEVVHCGAGFANFGFEFAEMIRRIVCALAFTLITQAHATSPAEQRGKTFALTNCARCHSIDRVSPSPLKIAPPFRTLHERYPIETIGEALAEGISTGHPAISA
jgi:cytochrome c553